MKNSLPVGKLPPALLSKFIQKAPTGDPRVVLGPGIGLDCAVLDAGETLWVFKSEPITFATDNIGWYTVQIAANDIATTGAAPRWMLLTLLLPEGKTTPELVEMIGEQVNDACRQMGITVIGGHTEITHTLDRPIVNATLIGEVTRERLVTPRGASPGDRILLTNGVPIEATAILAREFAPKLGAVLSAEELRQAQNFLFDPGISVTPAAQAALAAGHVTAMHDPTEGGVATALWELAEAAQVSLCVNLDAIPIPDLSKTICNYFDINPLAAIASGALLLTTPPGQADAIISGLSAAGITCSDIGFVEKGPVGVWCHDCKERTPLIQPQRDEIARVYEEDSVIQE